MFTMYDGAGGTGVYSEDCIRCHKPYRVALPVAAFLKWQAPGRGQKAEKLFPQVAAEDRAFLETHVCPRCVKRAEAAKLPLVPRVRARLSLFWHGARTV